MTLATRKSTLITWLLVCSTVTVAAQTNQSRLMGAVTDGSGAALPGVTVTIRAGKLRRFRS